MSDPIVGYQYQAENYPADDIVGVLAGAYSAQFDQVDPAVLTNGTTEEILDALAIVMGVNRQDERTFDSGDFPKVVFDSQLVCEDRDWTDKAPAHEYVSGKCVECEKEEPRLFWVIFYNSYKENGPFNTRKEADDWAFDSTGSTDYRILPGNDNWAFTE